MGLCFSRSDSIPLSSPLASVDFHHFPGLCVMVHKSANASRSREGEGWRATSVTRDAYGVDVMCAHILLVVWQCSGRFRFLQGPRYFEVRDSMDPTSSQTTRSFLAQRDGQRITKFASVGSCRSVYNQLQCTYRSCL